MQFRIKIDSDCFCSFFSINFIKYRYILPQGLYSCCAPHRIYRTYCMYRCDHLPATGPSRIRLAVSGSNAHANWASQSSARLASAILSSNLSCSRNSFCDISRMRCDLRCDDSLFYIFYIRQSQMFCRCYIAEECCPLIAATAPPIAAVI